MWFTLFVAILLATEAVGVADPAFSIVMNVTGWSPMFANVTGPVYNDNSPSRFYCYAIISPEPWWWNPKALPTADAQKPEYRPDQTLLMLPLDPAAEYRLVIGALGRTRTYSVSGITTYAYVK